MWSQACNVAFNNLKTKLISAPVLTYPRFDLEAGPFTVYTDASGTGLGAVLEQDDQVVALFSQSQNVSTV